MSLVWLSSYPKSGNTWLRALLSNYLAETSEPVAFDDYIGLPTAYDRRSFEDYCGLDSSLLSSDEIDGLRPYSYSNRAVETDGISFAKCHDAYRRTKEGAPIFAGAGIHCAIYMVRHPLDVAVSFAHHAGLSHEEAVKTLIEKRSTIQMTSGMTPSDSLDQQLEDWSTHVTSWTTADELSVLVIRYEDLLAETSSTFTRVLKHLQIPVDPQRLAVAISNSSFNVLKRLEMQHGFDEKVDASASFFREGKSGEGSTTLSAELITRLTDAHADVMVRHGYIPREAA